MVIQVEAAGHEHIWVQELRLPQGQAAGVRNCSWDVLSFRLQYQHLPSQRSLAKAGMTNLVICGGGSVGKPITATEVKVVKIDAANPSII